ncbi:hypothetical protein [Methylocaldum szegediense]|uniref:hypothetical protein n=1 Tax=Methylocaldum szegediense TaxID=73780 RepID=UPI00047B4B04|nr:hypothetical protein [Methylocaldum szegediense]
MRRFVIALPLLSPLPASAFDYILKFEQTCSYESASFKCERSSRTARISQKPNGSWVGREGSEQISLRVIKDDDYVLVLENPVLFSGTSTIHIMKATLRFYWSEVAYSEILKADEAHMRVGQVVLGKVN